jgi:AcrR family transcriptional regulator
MPSAVQADASSETRELILSAALRAFSDRGFDAATTREIATDAGVNHGLIRYYFGDKTKLWRAAVDRAFVELDAGVSAALGDSTVADDRVRLGRLIRNYVRFVARNPEFVRLMHEEGKRRGPRMRWLVDRHAKPLYEALSALSERARGRGVFQLDIAPIHLHYILAGSVGLIFHQAEECKRLSGVDPFDDAVVEEHARIVEHLLLGPPHEESSE